MSRESDDGKHNSSTLDDWSNYMNAKKSKLERQFKSEAETKDLKCDIFKGTSIFVNGYSIPSADELRHLMMDYGGIYHHYYRNGRTTYMIASNLPSVKIKQYKESSVKIIKPSWVTDSIKAGKMLDFRLYLLLNDFSKDQSKINFEKKNDDDDRDAGIFQNVKDFPSESKYDVEANDISPSKRIANRKTASDENFLGEFYNNSRLHHISTLGATFKQYVNDLRSKDNHEFTGRERLKNWKIKNPTNENYQTINPCIMHIDMDCFFVSVGLRKRLDLKQLPVVVTHAKGNKVVNSNKEDRKAEFDLHKKRFTEHYRDATEYNPWFTNIGESDSMAEIASCNYEARKLGIRNGMLLGQAFKLCPNLKTIPYDFEGYKEVSYALFNHVASYTLDIEAVSCDEMFVDCSSILSYTKASVLEFATFIRNEIKETTGCTCSTGFGHNRLVARLATKKAKPNGQCYVSTEDVKHFIRDFNVRDLPGVGHSIAIKLSNMGVKSCDDLQNVPVTQLQSEFGNKMGLNLHSYALGEDVRPLNFCHQRKSVSAEVNYGIRFQNVEEAKAFFKKLSLEIENRLNAIGMIGKSITFKLMIKAEDAPQETAKFLGHGICDYITKSVSLINSTADSEVIYREVLKIYQNLKVNPSDLRGVGIQISRLESKKNSSKLSGKIDSFVIKTKREEVTDKNVCKQSVIKKKSEEIPDESLCRPSTSNDTTFNVPVAECRETKHLDLPAFNEAEYDVTLSQIDPNYLAALPNNLRQEVVAGAKKRKSKSTKSVIDSTIVESSPYHYILIDKDVRKLNPLAPPTDITKAITEWVSKRKTPLEYDVKMLSDYLQQLLSKKEFESVNFIVNHFQKEITNNEQTTWRDAYQFITNVVKEAMKSNYFNVFQNE